MKTRGFQKKVAELLLNRQSVILHAPTGSGKTHAALLPFLHAHEHGLDFPTKCIYSVPMRVLANQFFDEYGAAITRAGRDDRLKTSIQTGDNQRDREFANDLIFATIDQTLSSFLVSPYSLSRRKANMNAGAVIGAYLVFDEFHLYEKTTLATALHMLDMLKGITPFLLMTATASDEMLSWLKKRLGAVVVPSTAEERAEFENLESQRKTRRYCVADRPLSAEVVLEKHKRRSLVICNRVHRAQQLYEHLLELVPAGTEVLLLHARFLRGDRSDTENRIRAVFGKDADQAGDYIAVSTQAIEVGVDITSEALHTELAPANAIIQRAGRCARYRGDEGTVYIYSDTTDGNATLDLSENPAPYMGQTDLFNATLKEFRVRNGHALDFEDEQGVVAAVHSEHDKSIIAELEADSYAHRGEMFAVMRGDEGADARHLIREVFQQQVTIHANPQALLEAPFDAPSFGLHVGTMQAYIKDWLVRGEALGIDVPVYYLWQPSKALQGTSDEQDNVSQYKWEPIYSHNRAEIALGAPLIVVHPALATYHPKLGFLPERGDYPEWQAKLPERLQRHENPPQTYRLETYEEHIRQVYQAFTELWQEMTHAAQRLEQRYGWGAGSVQRAAELAVLLHDVGKLSVRWQQWVRDYQTKIDLPIDEGRVYAHTELQRDDHRKVEREMPKRPWHAVESAWVVEPLLRQLFGDEAILITAVYSAIARHHAAYSFKNEKYRLVPDAERIIPSMLSQHSYETVPFNLNLVGQAEEDRDGQYVIDLNDDPHNDEIDCFIAYLLMVRTLRRADQLGTHRGTLNEH